jgi:hypothetical protein
MFKNLTQRFALPFAKVSLMLLLVANSGIVSAQAPVVPAAEAEKPKVDHSYKPLKLKLNEDGSKYVRFIVWNQIWAKYTQTNPGTYGNGKDITETADFGARRLRFLVQAQVSPRYMIVAHWGINNQSSADLTNAGNTKKPGIFIHDAWNEFAVLPGKLHVGAGLHYWNGISRLASASTLNMMTLDAPIFNWPTIDADDQFARQYGIYAKGKLGGFDYRVALNKPFQSGPLATAANLPNPNTNLGDGDASRVASLSLSNNFATQGYLQYQCWDKEDNTLPFMVGTYLGSKRILNFGAGWYNQAGASASKGVATTVDSLANIKLHDHTLLGADVFYEQPIDKAKNTAISVYASYYNYNFGPNYVRNIGIMNYFDTNPNYLNPDVTKRSYAGAGNAQPTVGTGSIFYTQVGYLLPKMGDKGQLMPYVCYTMKSFNGLKGSTNNFDLGLNYFMAGHNAKFTLQYTMRPIVDRTSLLQSGYGGELILQSHFFL